MKEGALWENEDTRTFYEQLLDLKLSFPPGFFEDKKGKGKETKEDGAKPAADKPQEDKDKDQMTEAELEALEKEMEKDEDKAPKVEEEYKLFFVCLLVCFIKLTFSCTIGIQRTRQDLHQSLTVSLPVSPTASTESWWIPSRLISAI